MAKQVKEGVYISNRKNISEEKTKKFDKVVSVCGNSCGSNVSCEYEGYDLREVDHPTVMKAIDSVFNARIRRETVCVYCSTLDKLSRPICFAAIALVDNTSYVGSVNRFADENYTKPDEPLFVSIQQYVGEGGR